MHGPHHRPPFGGWHPRPPHHPPHHGGCCISLLAIVGAAIALIATCFLAF